MQQHGVEVPLDHLQVMRTDHGVTIGNHIIHADLVEHLFAAIGGLNICDGLRIDVFGPEIPLLDGGALRLSHALRQLHIATSERRPRITKHAAISVAQSEYRFTPSSKTQLSIDIDFDHPLIIEQHAEWGGAPDYFLMRIAPARTFGFRKDAERLRAAGRAQHVDPRFVVVLDDNETSESSPAPDECAQHKLLDLIGDLTIAGGVPLGIIEATRPGHHATHEAISIARMQGVITPGRW